MFRKSASKLIEIYLQHLSRYHSWRLCFPLEILGFVLFFSKWYSLLRQRCFTTRKKKKISNIFFSFPWTETCRQILILSRRLLETRLQHSEVYSRLWKWLLKKRLKEERAIGALSRLSPGGSIKTDGSVLSVGSLEKWTLRVHRTRTGTMR